MKEQAPSAISLIILFLAGFLSAGALFAQDPTASESIRVQQGFEHYRIERQIQQATAPLPVFKITSPQQPPPDIDGKSQQKIFKLNHVIFEPKPGGVPQTELETVAAKYVAMDTVSIYDLYCMVVEIDTLFDERHLLGRAGLPEQDVENGTVTVQIIEGRESDRNIKIVDPKYFGIGSTFSSMGNAWVPSSRLFGQYFVRHQFRFSDKSSFNIQKLENEILRYNRTFNSQLSAGLEPSGDENGEFKLNLTRRLPQLLSGGYSLDNTGRESSGKIRNGVHVNVRDILGANDSFSIFYDKTEGTSSLSVRGDILISPFIPFIGSFISPFGTFFEMSYYYGEPKTISGAFAALLINGKSEQYRPGFRHIIANKEKHRLDATLHYEDYDSRTYFDKALNYAEKHDAWTTGLEYSGQFITAAGFSFIMGHAKTLSLPKPDYTDSDFKLVKMNLMKVLSAKEKLDDCVLKSDQRCSRLFSKIISWVWSPGKATLILRGNAGAALSDLPQSQFFQIGGMSTVRGTPEALVSGDTGYLSVAEYRRFFWNGKGKSYFSRSNAQFFVFFDHGGVFGRDDPDFLSSFGGGGTMRFGRNFSLTGGYGIPVLKGKASEIYSDKLPTWSWNNLSFAFGVSF